MDKKVIFCKGKGSRERERGVRQELKEREQRQGKRGGETDKNERRKGRERNLEREREETIE